MAPHAAAPAVAVPEAAASATPARAPAGGVPRLDRLRGVLFDIDGTLTDSDPLHMAAFRELLMDAGYNGGRPICQAFYNEAISGRHNPDIAADLWPDWPEDKRIAFTDEKEARFRKLAGAPGAVVPTPGLPEFLAWLDARRLPKAAVTNAPRANMEAILGALGLGAYFGAVVLGEDCARAKPHPEPYLAACAALGLEPGPDVLVVEDSPSGVAAGVAAGLSVVGLTTSQSEERLRAAGACATLPDFHALLALGLSAADA